MQYRLCKPGAEVQGCNTGYVSLGLKLTYVKTGLAKRHCNVFTVSKALLNCKDVV